MVLQSSPENDSEYNFADSKNSMSPQHNIYTVIEGTKRLSIANLEDSHEGALRIKPNRIEQQLKSESYQPTEDSVDDDFTPKTPRTET